jgi:cell division protein FtsI (penicillin-binding protein 3)
MRGLQHSTRSRPASRIVQAESTQTRAQEQTKLRLVCVAAFFAFSFLALSLRLIEVGVMGSDSLPFKRLVSEPQLLLQREDDLDISKVAQGLRVLRRDIVDRHGNVLATSIATASLVANPTLIRHEADVAKALAGIFPQEPKARILERLMRKQSSFVYLRRHLTPGQQEAVNNLGVPGLFFEPDMRRVYPYGGMFSHVLGYVGVDNQGLAGIEKHFDHNLEEPWHRGPLQLSLDLRVQAVLHQEMLATIREFSAIGGAGIVADIKTGEVLAMVSMPDFDPHQPMALPDENRFNRVTLGTYEMGSVFKTFTAAAALQYNVVNMMDGYDASAPIRVASFTINDAHPENRWLSVPEIYAYSSNIGTVKMAMDVGTKRMRAFLGKLGLFEPVNIELPERSHPMIPADWKPINTMTISYGHGMSVSPLHVVQAVAALACKGERQPLTLVKRLKNAASQKENVASVVSEHTVEKINQLMRMTVTHGTAKSANALGYEVGGKTGTAEKISGRGYNADAKLASFVGVFPAHQPRYVILVMVDEPKGIKRTYGYATGGWVSAPVAGRVIERVAPMLGLAPAPSVYDAEVENVWKAAETQAKYVQQRQKPLGVHDVAF